MNNFTPEDLLLYLYNEMDPETRKGVELALEHDWTLREKLGVLKVTMQRLDRLIEPPRTEVVLNILHYASSKLAEPVR